MSRGTWHEHAASDIATHEHLAFAIHPKETLQNYHYVEITIGPEQKEKNRSGERPANSNKAAKQLGGRRNFI